MIRFYKLLLLLTLQLQLLVVVTANAWEWNFLDADSTDGVNIGLLQVRDAPTDPWGSVCSNGFDTNEGLAACAAVGMPISSSGYVGFFDQPASDFSNYYPLVSISCATPTTPLASCTVTPWTTSPICTAVTLIDCTQTTRSPITFVMKFSPPTWMNASIFSSSLMTAIRSHLTRHGITGVDAGRVHIQNTTTFPSGARNRFETRWQFTIGVPQHQELQEIIIANVWDVFPASMNLTSFNDILPPGPTPPPTTTHTPPPNSASTAAPTTVVDFTINNNTTPSQLQGSLDVYGGAVMTPCAVNTTDGYQTCRVAFDDAKKAKSALDAASAGQLDGVTGAAAEPIAEVDRDKGGSSVIGVYVLAALGAVVLVVVLGVVRWRMNASKRHWANVKRHNTNASNRRSPPRSPRSKRNGNDDKEEMLMASLEDLPPASRVMESV